MRGKFINFQGGNRILIKNVQEWGELKPEFDVCRQEEERSGLKTFLRASQMNDLLPDFFLLMNMIFFFVNEYDFFPPFLSSLSFSVPSKLFLLLYMLSKGNNYNLKIRRRGTNLKIDLKITSHAFHFDKWSTK